MFRHTDGALDVQTTKASIDILQTRSSIGPVHLLGEKTMFFAFIVLKSVNTFAVCCLGITLYSFVCLDAIYPSPAMPMIIERRRVSTTWNDAFVSKFSLPYGHFLNSNVHCPMVVGV